MGSSEVGKRPIVRLKKGDLYRFVIDYLQPIYGDVETELDFDTPFQLLTAVILSAQCTDKRVNVVTKKLFEDFPDAQTMAQCSPELMFEYIRSISYPNAKAKHLVGMAKKLMEEFGGVVPDTLKELTSLPGVGRKTANVIMAVVFGKAALAVDTHVFRVAHRLGLVPKSANTPLKVELALKKHIPTEEVAASHFWLLMHGRYVCTALRPKCPHCGLHDYCKGPIKVDK